MYNKYRIQPSKHTVWSKKIGPWKNIKECVLVSVEQLNSGANCLTPDGDTTQLFHTTQITIIILKGGVR